MKDVQMLHGQMLDGQMVDEQMKDVRMIEASSNDEHLMVQADEDRDYQLAIEMQ